jgi:ABC-type multidrug transport system ATPase subunit
MACAAEAKDVAICSIENLSKSFRSVSVLRECGFSLHTNETALLMGKNGAGKSTLLRVLAGLMTPDVGHVHWESEDAGYLAQDLQLYSSLTVLENLNFFARLRKRSAVPDLQRWGLDSLKDEQLQNLSKGLRQRVSLCRVFSQQSTYLLLDEPTTYLDVEGIEIFKSVLNEQLADTRLKGAFIVSHDISNCVPLVNRALVLQAGSITHDSKQEGSLSAVIDAYREGNR